MFQQSGRLCAVGGLSFYRKEIDGRTVVEGISGGDFNALAAAEICGQHGVMLTALVPDHPLTKRVMRSVCRVDPATGEQSLRLAQPVRFPYDRVTGHNYSSVHYEVGAGPAADRAFYQRGVANREAAAFLKPGDFDMQRLVEEDQVRWLHSTGIFAAIGPQTGELIIDLMQAARQLGCVTSFDGNFRKLLFEHLLGDADRALELMTEIASNCDILMGNEEDLQKGFGIEGPDMASKDAEFTLEHFKRMAETAAERFGVRAVVSTLRHADSHEFNRWGAFGWFAGEAYEIRPTPIMVVDRVGGGDAFAGAVIAELMKGSDPQTALQVGVTAGAICAAAWGDTLQCSREVLYAAAGGNASRIAR